MENKILKACLLDRQAWSIAYEQDLFRSELSFGVILWQAIAEYYQRDEVAPCIDPEVLIGSLVAAYPAQETLFTTWIRTIDSVQVSPANVLDYIITLKSSDILEQIKAASGAGKTKEVLSLSEKLAALTELQDKEVVAEYEMYQGTDISSLLVKHRPDNLIKVYPHSLTMFLDGGIPRSTNTNIMLYAQTEVGKTLFAINMAYGFCKQGLKVLYIQNEESVERILLRFLSRFCSTPGDVWEKSRIIQHPTEAAEIARSRGYNNLCLVPLYPGTLRDLTKLASMAGDVLVIDQMANLAESDEVGAKAQVSRLIRTLGKKYGLITVSVAQANMRVDMGGQLREKLKLEKSDVYGAKVSVPGDLDLMIGIGTNTEFNDKNWRYLNIVKNKISGQNSGFAVKIVPEISKVESI